MAKEFFAGRSRRASSHGLRIVGRVVARFAEELVVVDHRGGHLHPAAVIVNAKGAGVHAGDQGRARRRANRSGRKGVAIANCPRGKLVEFGRFGLGIAVTAKVGAVILARNPEDVGPVGGGEQSPEPGAQEEEQKKGEGCHEDRDVASPPCQRNHLTTGSRTRSSWRTISACRIPCLGP
jgi:hypothetical protein